ncbi:MAG: pantoate--beta-alanine ligase [Chitinophagales bacterium]|nr:pantoate--beta-alanine ligase [Chitinophagales bacterium]
MIVLKKSSECLDLVVLKKSKGSIVGLVPTMGALHAGHLSLIKASKQENDFTVCSIFVNPTQFNEIEDFIQYPKPTENDIGLLEQAECDLLFLPNENEIYDKGINELDTYHLGYLEHYLEGASRPGHFKGVANVVDRFLKIIKPDHLYLGQKDYQQVKVLQALLLQKKFATKIVMCPIVRESNGLAMSSRNERLTEQQRKNAGGIAETLFFIRDNYRNYGLPELQKKSIARINSIPEAKLDYLEFCDADAFTTVSDWNSAKHIVVVTAVKIAAVRLLDNILLH